MSVDRPTFNDSWHRVAELRPRLRTVVRTYRQQYRGRMWHVIDDPTNNQFFRLDDSAYHLVALLDGRRTVAQAWDIANEQLGDAAPTQGEVIRLLGQLYTSNLLHAELPPDAELMFERYKKRVRREIGGYLASFLYLRIPIWDPNNTLKTWERALGWLFGPVGFVLWLAVIGFGLASVAGRWDELVASANPQTLLATDNLLLLYLSFALIKFIHEMGHGLACVHMGRKEGVSGAVHTMGIMMLVLMPAPYVDATSSWAFRSKWRRAYVAAAGMYVELPVAALAAYLWSVTASGTVVHDIAYNVMFIASVSTLLFNANPLLRFDGYYILSDVLEIANLAGRSKQYVQHLVKTHVYGVRRLPNPSHTRGEAVWLAVYGVLSAVYRIYISIAILLYISDVFPLIGALMAISAIVMWLVVPIGKFLKYLATSPELERTRLRAMVTSGAFAGAVAVGIGLIPAPDRGRADGVVEPVNMAIVYMPSDGVVRTVLASGTAVAPGGAPLMVADNRQLASEVRQVEAQLRSAEVQLRRARAEQPDAVEAFGEQVAALHERLDRVNERIERLSVDPPLAGVWVSDDSKQISGVYLSRGERIGLVADAGDLIIRVAAEQSLGDRVREDLGVGKGIELRVKGAPDIAMTGTVIKVAESAETELPSKALGYAAGGSMAVAMDDREGTRAAERFVEVHVRPDRPELLHIGQRVVVRFTMPDRPLAVQWWRAAQQLLQRRFGMS